MSGVSPWLGWLFGWLVAPSRRRPSRGTNRDRDETDNRTVKNILFEPKFFL